MKKGMFEKEIIRFKRHLYYKFKQLEKIIYTKADHKIFMAWLEKAMRELRDIK